MRDVPRTEWFSMEHETRELFDSLGKARWATAARAFGNAHSTLIGLLIDLWISAAPESRWTLDGGQSFGYHARGVGGGRCDAILGEKGHAVGVVEVEGTLVVSTTEKIGKFFATECPDLHFLRFAICFVYACTPQGCARARHFLPAASPDLKKRLVALSATYPDNAVILIAPQRA